MFKNSLKVNAFDLDSMIDLMENYGSTEHMLFGKNEIGEFATISISKDRVLMQTYQSNGWIRKNVYYRDGTVEELLMDKEDPYDPEIDD